MPDSTVLHIPRTKHFLPTQRNHATPTTPSALGTENSSANTAITTTSPPNNDFPAQCSAKLNNAHSLSLIVDDDVVIVFLLNGDGVGCGWSAFSISARCV